HVKGKLLKKQVIDCFLFFHFRFFGFVARKQGSTTDNVSHLFAELDPDQPATAIVNFVSKVMIGSQKR
ncbi:tensin-1 isoform X1, partial [Tachysurus ichikawai]